MKKRIYIIEDNSELVEFVKDYLERTGEFEVHGFTQGTDALKVIKAKKPDLILLDLGLKDIRGETICVEVRNMHQDLPIIILTGNKSSASVVSSLNSGADDYITKPFVADELLARIRARLRGAGDITTSKVLTSKDLNLNLETFEVERAGKKIDLTAKEFELLKYLLINKGRIISREKILDSVWGYSAAIETRVVDVHVGKLRKKIEEEFDGPPLLDTVRGFGYKIVE